MVQEWVILSSLTFLLVLPPMSLLVSFFLVLFIKFNGNLLRIKYQNKLALWMVLTFLVLALGRVEYSLELHLLPVVPQVVGVVPFILYSICVANAAKRLQGMNYNKFLGLLGCLPFIGPLILIWLAFTIRERSANPI